MKPNAVSVFAIQVLLICVSGFAGIPGDFDSDSSVGFPDMLVFAEQWLLTGDTLTADIAPLPDGDAKVDWLDFSEFAEYWRTILDSEIPASFDRLIEYIDELTDDGFLNAEQQAILTEELNSAQDAYNSGQHCVSVEILGMYLEDANALRGQVEDAIAEDLYNRGWMLIQNILTGLGQGRVCPVFEGHNEEPSAEVITSDNTQITSTVSFGDPRLWSVEAEGELYTEIELPGIMPGNGEPGKPCVPVYRCLIAVPIGAVASISLTEPPTVDMTIPANLYPFQPQAVDYDPNDPNRYENPPFEKDEDLYASGELYPQQICRVTSLGRLRDMQLAQVSIAAGQYDTATDSITLFESAGFEITFSGGNGYLTTEEALGPFEKNAAASHSSLLMNKNDLLNYAEPNAPRDTEDHGEELLILTHPDFRQAADALAGWKNEKGIITSVFNVADDANQPDLDRAHVIRDFIRERYDTCTVRPAYVILLGDAEFVPTCPTRAYWPCTSPDGVEFEVLYGHDFFYAVYDLCDTFATFAIGRISVDTIEQANTVVNKIIQYESNPPVTQSYYDNAAFASFFQCCRSGEPAGRTERGYIETCEQARNALLDNGYDVQRIYTSNPDRGVPSRYYNGTLLPEELRVDKGFAWDGDTQDVINAFNDGRFLIIHRDHGRADRWSDPNFTVEHILESLENADLLPVVFSVNCLTGLFQNEIVGGSYGMTYGTDPNGTYFVETLLRSETGGAAGVLAAVVESPTWANNVLTIGFFDALWPGTVPEFHGNASFNRLGDILNHAEFYMLTKIGADNTTEPVSLRYARMNMVIWEVFGDPTMEMWTANPVNLPDDFTQTGSVESMQVEYEMEGVTITAYQKAADGTIIPLGRSMVQDGVADVNFIQPADSNLPVLLSVSKKNAVSIMLTPLLGVEPFSLDFAADTLELSLTITNIGGGTLNWDIDDDIPAWLGLSPSNGALSSDQSETVIVTVERGGLSVGAYDSIIELTSDGGDRDIPVSMSVPQKYDGGIGTLDDPYEIRTAEQMNQIGLDEADWDKHFILVDNIDLGEYTGTEYNIIGVDWTRFFSGVFDGNDHTISNFTCTSPGADYVGIFGLARGAQIKNIGLIDVGIDYEHRSYVGSLVGAMDGGIIANCYATGNISGEPTVGAWHIGGLAGSCYGELAITNCYSTVSVSGNQHIGGLIGVQNDSDCEIVNCYSTGTISGSRDTGGLVGWNGGVLTDCYSTSDVTGTWENVGGLVGEAYGGTVMSNCYSTGTVSGEDEVGGLVGYKASHGTISNCYATCTVSGRNNVGGLLGRSNYGGVFASWARGSVEAAGEDAGGLAGYNSGTFDSCYSAVSVSGVDTVGGLVGENTWGGTITTCYSTGSVSGTTNVGGLVGMNSSSVSNPASIENSFWDAETSDANNMCGMQGDYATGCDNSCGKTTAEMKQQATFTGWDFVGETANGTEDIWQMCEAGVDYPHLTWEFISGGFECPTGAALGDILHLANRWLEADPEALTLADAAVATSLTAERFLVIAEH